MTDFEAAKRDAMAAAVLTGGWVAVHATGCEPNGTLDYVVRRHDRPLGRFDHRRARRRVLHHRRGTIVTDKLTLTASRVVAVFTDAALFASDDTLHPVLNGCDARRVGVRAEHTRGGEAVTDELDDLQTLGDIAIKVSLEAHYVTRALVNWCGILGDAWVDRFTLPGWGQTRRTSAVTLT